MENTTRNKDIIDIMKGRLSIYEIKELITLPEDTYLNQKTKALNKLRDFFGEEIRENAKIITKTKDFKDKFQTIDKLSFVKMGNELINELNQNDDTHVIPYLYELIQTKYQPHNYYHNIIYSRLNYLKNLYNEYIAFLRKYQFRLLEEELEKHTEKFNEQFLSYYYSILLYQNYIKEEEKVIAEIKDVITNKETTEELLHNYDIINKWDLFNFSVTYEKILKKTM